MFIQRIQSRIGLQLLQSTYHFDITVVEAILLLTWIYDELGCAGAILDEFCVRNTEGKAVAWVFGLSVFSVSGGHIGWFEDGVFFDVDNRMLGFVPGAREGNCAFPSTAPPPPVPALSKRPQVPMLRGRRARPANTGWSTQCLAGYLESAVLPVPASAFLPPSAGGVRDTGTRIRH